MNIAILVAGLPPERVGGAEIQASRMASHLALKHDVTVFTRTTSVSAELASRPRCAVVQRCSITVPGLRFAADIIQTLILIGRSKKKIDVIVAYQTVIDGLIGVFAKILFHIPVVVSVRSDMEYQLDRYPQSRWFTPFVFRHADSLAVQSKTLADQLVRALDRKGRRPTTDELQAKLFVLPNGISLGTLRSTTGEGVVFIGRLTRSKGVETLIDAMRDCPQERLTVIGDGPQRRALQKAARGQPNITFTGMVDHERAGNLLAGARMLVLPSWQEGQPNIVMEAMARGVPVIATRVGALPDLITHRSSGWLIEPGDANGLALAIRTLGADEKLREQLASRAAIEIQQYVWPVVVARLERELVEITRTPHK